jgi:hypothetical protein
MVRRVLAVLGLAVAAGAFGIGPTAEVDALPAWAPAATATIHPGVQMRTEGGQCTAGFAFHDGDEVYLAFSAHCAAKNPAAGGCDAEPFALGSKVEISGASRPGTLAYTSWGAMQAAGEQDEITCIVNDFALVRVDPADHARMNPSLPHWGGPTGINRRPLPPLSAVYSVGNSGLRGGLTLLQPKKGFIVEELAGSRFHGVYFLTPGIPGDSGSAIVEAHGLASGSMTSLVLPTEVSLGAVLAAPRTGSNYYTDLALAYDYARAHGHPGLRLLVGTLPFDGSKAPLGSL